MENDFEFQLPHTEHFWLLFIKTQAGYAYIDNFWDVFWVCILIFLFFDGCQK